MGTHSQPRKRIKKRLGLPIVGWVVLLTAGVAIAGYMVMTATTGSIDIAAMAVELDGDPTVTAGSCTATSTGGGDWELLWPDAMPGMTCAVTVPYRSNNGTIDVLLGDFRFAAGDAVDPAHFVYGIADGGCETRPDATTGDVNLVFDILGDPDNEMVNTSLVFAEGDGAVWYSSMVDYVDADCHKYVTP